VSRRIAIVDIGTNSSRLYVADVEAGRITQELDRRTTVTRLGQGVDANKSLQPEAMERVYATVADYRAEIDRHGADHAVAVLTSAVRDATNGQWFAHTLHRIFDLDARILTGDEEANLTFLGATSERDPDDARRTLVIDIGGGSTELVIGMGRTPSFHVSTQAGVVRQTERHIHTDPPTAEELAETARDVDEILRAAVPEHERQSVETAIAVAGTPTSLAAIAQELEPYDPARVHGYVVTAAERDRILETLAAMPLAERQRVPGLHPARAPTIVPGVVILGEVMSLFGLDEVEVSEHDILRGAAMSISGELA
jgi:exopolyphosphatase / guanosine-5'-triphosphate,3'-diphosphate pyrophosphatase